jgi:hypothetical protein
MDIAGLLGTLVVSGWRFVLRTMCQSQKDGLAVCLVDGIDSKVVT